MTNGDIGNTFLQQLSKKKKIGFANILLGHLRLGPSFVPKVMQTYVLNCLMIIVMVGVPS